MATQLQLIESNNRWKIDSETKEVGRKGLAAARQALARTKAPSTEDRLDEAA
jgi:hypothetical protein